MLQYQMNVLEVYRMTSSFISKFEIFWNQFWVLTLQVDFFEVFVRVDRIV